MSYSYVLECRVAKGEGVGWYVPVRQHSSDSNWDTESSKPIWKSILRQKIRRERKKEDSCHSTFKPWV